MSEIQMEAEVPAELPLEKSGRKLPVALVVGAIYALLVLLMWGPLGWKQGMPYETGFPYMSQSESWWHAFIFWGDTLRPYTNVTYHLSYLLSALLGMKGSFLPYQLVYIALWWGRGFFAFLIFQRLLPGRKLFNFALGALVIAHASDHALNWVGQMNQFGMMFGMMLSIFLLIRALESRRIGTAVLWLLGSMAACHYALWSYESELFIICLVPLLLLVMRYGLTRRTVAVAVGFWIVPLVYIGLTAQRYLGAAGSSSYQESVLRHDFAPGVIIADWWFNIKTSLFFWDWGSGMPHSPYYLPAWGWWIGGMAVMVVVGGILWMMRGLRQAEQEVNVTPSIGQGLKVLSAGVLVLVFSFPAYLILSSARMVWRTQFLSGIGAAMVFAALLGLLATLLRNRVWRGVVFGAGCAAVALFAARAAFVMSDFHYGIWERHRRAIAEILQIAPHLKDGTLVVLTNVPGSADPFGNVMWFDMAIRLAYPHHEISGVYYRADESEPPGFGMAVRHGQWVYDNHGYPPLIRQTDLSNTVVVRYDANGAGRLLNYIPAFITSDPAASTYDPASRIYGQKPNKMALRRYVR